MDIGDLFAGLNALDVVRVKRDPSGAYASLVSDSEVLPVTDRQNHDSEHTAIGLPEQTADTSSSVGYLQPITPRYQPVSQAACTLRRTLLARLLNRWLKQLIAHWLIPM